MKVTVDGIIGSARRINSQKQLEEDNLNNKKREVKADSVSIGSRINSRLDIIGNEIREIQSSLTRNQIIRDGIEQLQNDLGRGGQNLKEILNEVKSDGKDILRNFIGDNITETLLASKFKRNSELINTDVDSLKKLQVELDNIMASDLALQDRVESIMTDIDSMFSNSNVENLESISRLRPDSVMRLIK